MRKGCRLIRVLFLFIGTGFILLVGRSEIERQARRNEAAERFIKTAILFQSADFDGLSDCYPVEIGEDFVFDLNETYRCLDFKTKEILSEVTFEIAESRRLNKEESERIESVLEGANKFSGACWTKVRLSIPGREMEQILECMILEYDGHYGVWGIHTDDLDFYLWENREKILLMTAYYDEEGRMWDWTEYRYNNNGNPEIEIFYLNNDEIHSWKTYEYDLSGELVEEVDYWYGNSGSLEKEEIRYEYSYVYNDCKNVIWKEQNEYESRYEHVYDDSGDRYREAGESSLYSKTVYNEKGDEIWRFLYGDEENVKTA